MATLWLGLALVAGLLLVVALVSRLLQTSPISDALIALLLGIAIGPMALDLLHLGGDTLAHPFIRAVARITLAVGVMAIALRIPLSGVNRRSLTSLGVVLGVVMPAMWLATAFIVWLVLGTSVVGALLVAAPLTPTDPILASGVVSGPLTEKYVPGRIRNLLLAESGINDGLGLPFVALALALTQNASTDTFLTLIWRVLLVSVVAAGAAGFAIGYGSGRLLRIATSRDFVRRPGLLGFSLALTGLVVGAGALLDVSAIFATFFAGIGLNRALQEEHQRPQRQAQEIASRFLSLPVFMLLGIALPWHTWFQQGIWLLVAGVAILLFRRVPAMLAASFIIPAVRGVPDALFIGWFGPIGIAALYYALHEGGQGAQPLVYTLATLTVCLSVVIHGLSGPALSRQYERLGRARRKKS